MLTLWELAPSPNNTKVRMALRFKGIEFEGLPVDPRERQPLLDLTGQANSPAIQDRGIVLNDSEAILQYLDANYPETPRLFPRLKAGRRECDQWKQQLDERVAAAWFPLFAYSIGRRDELDEGARVIFRDALAALDDELGDRDSFKDDPEMAICDLRVAEWATYALPGAGLIARVRLFRRFKEVYAISEGSLPNLERFLVRWNEYLA